MRFLQFSVLLVALVWAGQLRAQCTGLTVGTPSVSNVACFGDQNGIINMAVQVDSLVCSSPTVAINEVMYRPSQSNGVDPNTGEYIELIGPPGANIGCFVLTDGDWAIVIPPGTTIPADGLFTIGNNIVYGPNTFDLDAENCNCFSEGTGGSALLILTDGGEYVAMFNSSGTFVQGMIYGSPTGANNPSAGTVINLPSVTGCGLSNVTLPAASSFSTALGGVNNGTSLIRDPDGSGPWTSQAGGSVNACNTSQVNGYSVLWSNGATTNNLTGLAAGTYTVTVTHSSGCTVTQAATVTQPTQLALVVDSTRQASCLANNGAAFVTATGGTGAYTFAWSNGATTRNLTGVTSGVYSVTATDVRGCQTTAAATVTSASGLQASSTVLDVSCAGAADGSIAVNVTGGQPSPTFAWSNGRTTQNITGLSAGAYSLTITESNGCVTTLQSQVAEPVALNVALASSQNVACFGDNNGAITTNVSGGTAPYLFAWSNGITTANLNNIVAGAYAATVTDANGCVAALGVTITEPAAFVAQAVAVVDRLDCDLLPVGEINLSTTGGTAPVSVLWSDGNTEPLRDGLAAGNYSLTATDANGCTATATAVVTAPLVPVLNAIFDTTNTNVHSCLTNTAVRIRATNTPDPQIGYVWSANAAINFSTTTEADAIITPTEAGVYTMVVSANSIDGCAASDTITLEVYDNFLGIPSAFTPNGDGENDLFRPVNLNAQYIKTFQIYNRWGQLVYDDSSLAAGGWDGTISGQAQARDVYVYVITYQLPQATEQQERGTFLLVR